MIFKIKADNQILPIISYFPSEGTGILSDQATSYQSYFDFGKEKSDFLFTRIVPIYFFTLFNANQ